MSSNFFSLPRELRGQIYELVLLHREVINPRVESSLWFSRPQFKLNTELLHVNKTIHHETSSLFYSQNRFDFTMGYPEDVASFLGQIGRNNADYIRHICVDFPNFLFDPVVTLDDYSVRILANIQSGCANLSTLTTTRRSTDMWEHRLNALCNPKVVTEALKLVNTHFRAISSLREIIFEVYHDGPSDHMRSEMESHGWTINITEYVVHGTFPDD